MRTLHQEITREAVACGRMTPKPMTIPLTREQKQILLALLDWQVRPTRSAKSKEIGWDCGWSTSKLRFHLFGNAKHSMRIAGDHYRDDDQNWLFVHWSRNGHIWLTKRGTAAAYQVLNEGP